MNIEDLVRWGDKILIKYENLQKSQKKTDDEIKLEGIIKNIEQLETSIKAWSEMVIVFELIERFMNIHGLQQDSYEKFYQLHGYKLLSLKTA